MVAVCKDPSSTPTSFIEAHHGPTVQKILDEHIAKKLA
jgi:hypothetical protein